MSLKWTDIHDLAIALQDAYPHANPLKISFVELASWVQSLEGFDDRPERCNEKILEAIQMAWLDERDDD